MYLQPSFLRKPPCLERGLREHDVFTALIPQKAAMLREELRELNVFTALITQKATMLREGIEGT